MSLLDYDGLDYHTGKFKTWVKKLLEGKSNAGHKHTKSDITDFPNLGTASSKDIASNGNASTTQVVMGNDTRLTDARKASDVSAWAKAAAKPTYTASEVGAYTKSETDTKLNSKINTSLKGSANGLAELDSNGKVPSTQLPSFVDDVIEGYLSSGKFYKESAHTTQISGESGKIYIDLSTEKTYRWSGSAFVVISETLALGETSSTAYRGDRGKTAYDHSQSTHARIDATKVEKSSTNGNIKINGTETNIYTHPSGTNPHGTTKSDVGLGNVGNFKAVSTVSNQGLSDTEKSNARSNIGAQVAGSYASSTHTHDDRYYTESEIDSKLNGKANSSHTHTKSQITDFPTSMPANGGNSTTVNGHTVNSNVPANAKFTDTTYNIATTTANGLMSKEHVSKLNNIQIKTYTSIESLGLSGTPTVNEIKLAMPLYSELLIEVNFLASKTDSEGNTLDNASCRIVKLNSDGRAWAEAHGKSDGKHYVMRLGKSDSAPNDFTEIWEQIAMNSDKTEDFYFMKYYDYLQDPSKNLFVKSTNINDKIESNGRGFTRTTDEPALLIKIRHDNASTGNYWTGFGILAKTKYGCITGTPGNAYSNIDTTDIAVETTPNGNTVYVSHMASAWTNNNYPCTITTTNGTIKSISEPVYYLGTTTNKNKLNKFILAVADYLLFDSNDILPILNSFSKNNLSADAITTSQLTVTDISHYINDKSLYFKTGNDEAGFINYTTSNSTIYSSGDTTKTGVVGFHVGNSAYNTRLEGDYLYLYGGTMLSANTTLRTGSDEKVKVFTNDIESDNDNLIKLFDIINPKTYKYRYLTNDKLNIGFSAQEVESAFLELGIKPEKYNILNISYNHMLNRGSDEEDCKYYTKFMSIAYSDLHNLAILKIKDMEERHTERLNSLENKLEMLEDKLGGVS